MAVPTVEEVQLYLGETSWSDEEVEEAYDAELAAQQAVVRAGYYVEDSEDESYREYTADLAEALKRRVARNLALRSVPMGVQVGEDTAAVYVPRRDPEVTRLEAPYRRLVVG